MDTIPIPPPFAADMAAAARRDTLAEREQRKAVVLFALIAIALGVLVYLAW
jgi:hypothetical protein